MHKNVTYNCRVIFLNKWVMRSILCIYVCVFNVTNFDAFELDASYERNLMECWNCRTPKPIQNGLYRIVWRCSYCTETDTNRFLSGSVLIYRYPCLSHGLFTLHGNGTRTGTRSRTGPVLDQCKHICMVLYFPFGHCSGPSPVFVHC